MKYCLKNVNYCWFFLNTVFSFPFILGMVKLLIEFKSQITHHTALLNLYQQLKIN